MVYFTGLDHIFFWVLPRTLREAVIKIGINQQELENP
jgi:hypothetical protein